MDHHLHRREDNVMSSLQCRCGRENATHDHRVEVGSRFRMEMLGN